MTNDEFVLYWLTVYLAFVHWRLLYLMYHERDNNIPGLFKWTPMIAAYCLFMVRWVV